MALQIFTDPNIGVPNYDISNAFSARQRIEQNISSKQRKDFQTNELQLNLDWTKRTNEADAMKRRKNLSGAYSTYQSVISEQIKHYQEIVQDPSTSPDDIARYEMKISNLGDRLDALSTQMQLSGDEGLKTKKEAFTNRDAEFAKQKKVIDTLFPVISDPNSSKLDKITALSSLYSTYIYGKNGDGNGLIDQIHIYRDLAEQDPQYQNELASAEKKLYTISQQYSDLVDFQTNPQDWVELYKTDEKGNIISSKFQRRDSQNVDATTSIDPVTGEAIQTEGWSSNSYKEIPGQPGKYIYLNTQGSGDAEKKFARIGDKELIYNKDVNALVDSSSSSGQSNGGFNFFGFNLGGVNKDIKPIDINWNSLNKVKPFANNSFVQDEQSGNVYFIRNGYKVPVNDAKSAIDYGFDENQLIPSPSEWIGAIQEDPSYKQFSDLFQQTVSPKAQPQIQPDKVNQNPFSALLPSQPAPSQAPFKPQQNPISNSPFQKDLMGSTLNKFLGNM